MCEYCRMSIGRHDSRCPLADAPEIIGNCEKCGAEIYEDDIFDENIIGYLTCEKCMEGEK